MQQLKISSTNESEESDVENEESTEESVETEE